MTDKMSAAPGGSRMFAFFNDVDDFRTNLSTICHTHTEVTTSRQKNCTIITTKAFTALNCWLGGRKGIRPVKTEWWGAASAGMVMCLEWGADLHTAQLMPLPLTVSCFSKIQIGFTFLVPAHPGSPGKKEPLNGFVYHYYCYSTFLSTLAYYVSDRYCCNNLVLICTQSGSRESMKYSNK